MNEEDTSLYGKNREGKVALCETCAYDGEPLGDTSSVP